MNYHKVLKFIDDELKPFYFECYPFKIEWYNSSVDNKYKLNYDDDTLAILVLNTPRMFENLFLPYLFNNFKENSSELDNLNDPIDNCMSIKFNETKKKLEEMLEVNGLDKVEIDVIKDYEVSPATRRARIIMQTCAHISGAAHYYDSKNSSFPENEKCLMGVCLHPSYGGWFALRSVFILKNFKVNDLSKKDPIDAFNGDISKIVDALHKFNYNWKDATYRDSIVVNEKYSDIQQKYFDTEPKYRKELIKEWLRFRDEGHLIQTYENQNIYNNFKTKYLVDNFFVV